MEFPSKEKPQKLPVPKEHQYLIWLLKKSITDTRHELEELDFYCKTLQKSDKWKQQEKRKLEERLEKLITQKAMYICALDPNF